MRTNLLEKFISLKKLVRDQLERLCTEFLLGIKKKYFALKRLLVRSCIVYKYFPIVTNKFILKEVKFKNDAL